MVERLHDKVGFILLLEVLGGLSTLVLVDALIFPDEQQTIDPATREE
jgi:hypothetical protein